MDPQREVSRELVLSLLEDAHWAPTHAQNQPWRFQVFASLAARTRLGEGLQSIYDKITPVDQRIDLKRAKLAANPLHAPVVIALGAHVVPGGKVPEWEEIAAVSCAVQNLMLSAHEQGLGTYWSSPPVTTSPEFGSWLGLDEAQRMMGLIYIGWPQAGQPTPHSTRDDLMNRVTWHEE